VFESGIDVGAPDAMRLHRASKAAPRVAVYTHKDAAQLAARLRPERIHRIEALELYAMDFDWLSDLAQRLQRRTQFHPDGVRTAIWYSLARSRDAVGGRQPNSPRAVELRALPCMYHAPPTRHPPDDPAEYSVSRDGVSDGLSAPARKPTSGSS